MNAKVLVPALIALQLTAVALVVGILGGEEHDSGPQDPAWQGAQWAPLADCFAQNENDDASRHALRQISGAAADWRACLNFH